MTSLGRGTLGAVGLLLGGCAWSGSGPGCRPPQQPVALPDGLEEASGVAVSRAYPGVFWTHGDGDDPTLFAVDSAGTLLARVQLATDVLVDWEDLALAACGEADCLYVADVGDNVEGRRQLRVLRVREPDPRAATTAQVEVFRMRLPEARDVEAIFVLPGERLHLVSKGSHHEVAVYRYPGSLRADTVAMLTESQRLSDGPRALPRQVTGAAASSDGERVAIRTYEALLLFRVEGDSLVALEKDGTVNLRTLEESQGEGVAVGEDGLIALTSEAGPAGRRGSLALLRCQW